MSKIKLTKSEEQCIEFMVLTYQEAVLKKWSYKDIVNSILESGFLDDEILMMIRALKTNKHFKRFNSA